MNSIANKIGSEITEEYKTRYKDIASDEQGFLKPFKLKLIGREKLKFRNIDNLIELIMAAALEEKRKNIKITYPPNKVTGAVVTAEYLLSIRDKPEFELSIDSAIIFKIDWWPDLYKEFKHRNRAWPPQIIIDDLTNSCNIISKPSDEELTNSETLEFRYSFAHLERALVMLRSRRQTFVYLVFKVLFVKNLKPVSRMARVKNYDVDDCSYQKLTSFFCKNTMLWMCERFPPEHKIWIESFGGLTFALEHLFKDLLGCFEAGNMPYFFDPQTNVIASISKELQSRVAVEIKDLLSDLHQFLYFNMEREFSVCRQLTELIRSISRVFNEIKKRDFSRIIAKQPELLPDVIAYFIKNFDLEKKIEEEIDKASARIEKEARRTGQKIEDEVQMASVRIEKEARRTGQKIEKEINRISSTIVNETISTVQKVERETQRVAEQVKDLFKKLRF